MHVYKFVWMNHMCTAAQGAGGHMARALSRRGEPAEKGVQCKGFPSFLCLLSLKFSIFQ
jgi:hypothetical protein